MSEKAWPPVINAILCAKVYRLSGRGPFRVNSFLPVLGIGLAFLNGMPLYYFKLVDSHVVADYGTHELEDDTAAQIEAIKLARSVREVRPELVGQHYSISVSVDGGGCVCTIPLEVT
jgi:hypothetical protein